MDIPNDRPNSPDEFLHQVRQVIRLKHLSLRTEDAYLSTIRRFLRFHARPTPDDLDPPKCAPTSHTSPSKDRSPPPHRMSPAMPCNSFTERSSASKTCPPRRHRTRQTPRATARRLYPPGSQKPARPPRRRAPPHGLPPLRRGAAAHGLRPPARQRHRPRNAPDHRPRRQRAEGPRHHAAPVPARSAASTRRVRTVYEQDLADGHADVYLPDALDRKYPNAGREWGWQWVFPARALSVDPRSGKTRRHHVGEETLQRAVKGAITKAGIAKPARATPCGTRSRPICSKTATISARSRNCSATPTFARP